MERIFLAFLMVMFSWSAACSSEEAPPEPPTPTAEEQAEAAKEAEPEPEPLPEWRFLEINGNVTIDGEPASVDMEIGKTSTIKVGDESNAVATLAAGSVVDLTAGTEVTFGKSERKEISAKLVAGSIWSFLTQGASYEVVGPNATAGVRGTVFYVEVPAAAKKAKKRKKAKRKTYVCACNGEIEIQAAHKKSFDKVVTSPSLDHKAFDIVDKGKRGKKQAVKKTKRRNHTDERKDTLMALMTSMSKDAEAEGAEDAPTEENAAPEEGETQKEPEQ